MPPELVKTAVSKLGPKTISTLQSFLPAASSVDEVVSIAKEAENIGPLRSLVDKLPEISSTVVTVCS